MPQSIRLIKNRIKSAKNISQVTKAMQMVASSKMRQAKNRVEQSQPYHRKIFEATAALMAKTDYHLHPLLSKPARDLRPLLVLITTNRGLCGNLNVNLFKKVTEFFQTKIENQKVVGDYLTLGTKGADFVLTLGGGYLADFSDLTPFHTSVNPISQTVTTQFVEGKNTSVWLLYNHFVNVLQQEPVVKEILPLKATANVSIQDEETEYLIEPSPKKILDFLLPFYLEAQLREAILEAEACEYAARMLAMKNATDNALDLKEGLTLKYNKARQQMITSEISDMVTAKISMEQDEK
jgi:F-type H+-transporting ATPase subunit gamma